MRIKFQNSLWNLWNFMEVYGIQMIQQNSALKS
jgi:hypothetical protein